MTIYSLIDSHILDAARIRTLLEVVQI
jgi:hypothetical protein